eukprot:TRINITY_DN65018_c0_g1_i2.p1 TRINITY_DN65018_c0_g1~~TRINITY_DN65018_c0_g1_i2.p1  ORF type:complete len:392 (+),score=37.65 TRINITY_DN65018_c0_g1_i2:78-1253(+)
MFRNRNRRDIDFIDLLLAYSLWQQIQRWRNKPPVTIGFIILMAFLYVAGRQDDVWTHCMKWDWLLNDPTQAYRLVTAQLYHASSIHLYYNMASFAFTGRFLERRLKSQPLFQLIVILGLLSQIVFAVIAFSIYPDAQGQCVIGFSGVLFGLAYYHSKLATHQWETYFGLFDIPVQHKPWFDLVLISVLNPGASFVGHLSGLLSGVVWWHYGKDVTNWARNVNPIDDIIHIPPRDQNPAQRRDGNDDQPPPPPPPSSKPTTFLVEPMTEKELGKNLVRLSEDNLPLSLLLQRIQDQVYKAQQYNAVGRLIGEVLVKHSWDTTAHKFVDDPHSWDTQNFRDDMNQYLLRIGRDRMLDSIPPASSHITAEIQASERRFEHWRRATGRLGYGALR